MKKETLQSIIEEYKIIVENQYERYGELGPETIKDFLTQSIKDALEACRVKEKGADGLEMSREYLKVMGWNKATTQYDENIKSFIGEK